ncbi:MAG TPA: VWA domain-containing protein [Mycobacteriales bacterium]|nr:VWA domain-containing protein [Mycobacteriales bacterium]
MVGQAEVAGGLLGRVEGFVGALREAGLPVGVSENLDAVRAFGAVDLLDREQLRAGLAATLVKRPVYRPTFDTLFDLWWPPLLGDGVLAGFEPGDGTGDGTEPPRPGAADPDALREILRGLLLDGDLDALRRFARFAVSAVGRAEADPARQSWFSYRVLRALNPDTLVASLLDALLAGADRGGMAEQVARRMIAERVAAFRSYVEAEVRRRAAEERGVERVSRTAVSPLADQVDFLRAQRADLTELRRTVRPLARRLAARLAARRRVGRAGRLDFRRTVRASLSTGGVPVVTRHRPRRTHKPELVVLCDVSGSVAGFAHFTLMLTAALRDQFSRVRAFAFVDTCDEVTRLFAPGADLADAVSRISRDADLVWFDGHSDYGHAFEVFDERWPDAVGPRTSLLILGDGRNNYRPTGLPTLRRLVGRARHAYWLNPEPRRMWGSGDSAATEYGRQVEMVECRNAAQLTEFVRTLLPT